VTVLPRGLAGVGDLEHLRHKIGDARSAIAVTQRTRLRLSRAPGFPGCRRDSQNKNNENGRQRDDNCTMTACEFLQLIRQSRTASLDGLVIQKVLNISRQIGG
jgi:hypothetical protein